MSEKLIPFDWQEAVKDLRRVRLNNGKEPAEIHKTTSGCLFIRWKYNASVWICYSGVCDLVWLRLVAPTPRVVQLQLYALDDRSEFAAYEIGKIKATHTELYPIGEPFEHEVPSE